MPRRLRNSATLATIGQTYETTEVQFVEVGLRVMRRETLPPPSNIGNVLSALGMYELSQESVWVVSFDGASGLRRVGMVARGSFHSVDVPIEGVLSMVLLMGTDRFWLVHNHPSGLMIPSPQDIDLTRKMMEASNACGLRFEDHVIIGPPHQSYSFRENGLILAEDEVAPIVQRSQSTTAANEKIVVRPTAIITLDA